MTLSIPVLDVVLIDFSKALGNKKAGILKAAAYILGGPVAYLATSKALKSIGEDGPSLKRLIDEKHFSIIDSPEELNNYTNANMNEWVIDSKSLKQRQYYIRHPKKSKQNILIETKDFYRYIEDEQKEELIQYIMSHCPAKSIQIDKTEIARLDGELSGVVRGMNVTGGATYGQVKGNYYSWTSQYGVPKSEPREEYLWLNKAIMSSISMMTEGATMTDAIECDFTCGLKATEAKTIGLDMNMHKKYIYTIHIQC